MENIPTHRSSKTAAVLMAAALAMPLVVSSPASANESNLVQKEIARRTLHIAEADKAISNGRKAYAERNYEEAVSQYQTAISLLPQGRIAADRRRAYTGHYVDGAVALAQQYRRVGKYTEARNLLEKVIIQDPGNILAKKQLEFLDDPIRTSPTLNYKHTQNVEKAKKLLYRAHSYYGQAQFDHALLEFKEVLRIDPYNKAARRGMEKVAAAKSDYYRAAYDQTRASMLAEVDQAWELSVPPKIPNSVFNPVTTQGEISPAAVIRNKLVTTMLPRVEFEEEATVRDAINFLRLRSIELDIATLDPNLKGVNFVFRNASVVGDDKMLVDDGKALVGNKIENIKLGELKLRNIPLIEALDQITKIAGLRFKIDNYSVIILNATSIETDDMYRRTFRVPPSFLKNLDDGGGEGEGGGGDVFNTEEGGQNRKTVVELLQSQGVKFVGDATASYSKRTSTLTVNNTQVALDQVEDIVLSMKNLRPKQVKIATKFIEISQENTDELGFDWVISPFGISSNSSFLSGGTQGNNLARRATDFVSPISGVGVGGVPAGANQNVSNLVTSGNRSGDFAITRDSIDSFLNNPNRTAQSSSVAPGILSLTGLFTDGQVQMIMRGLEQKKGADIMTAPSIVSRSGETAKIEIIREFIYPTEYDPPELPQAVGVGGGQGNNNGLGGNNAPQVFPVTPATPTTFETRNTGVILEVQPVLGEDNYTIELAFKPEIVEFEGFINYGSPIQSPGTDALGNPITVTITDNRIEMPVFSTRRVDSNITIFDGHTVAVGGLMRENVQNVEDKVPILGDLPLVGRLFQSKAENRIKSNLIIFVTARIIDATGEPVSATIVGPDGNPILPDDVTVPAGGSENLLPAIPAN